MLRLPSMETPVAVKVTELLRNGERKSLELFDYTQGDYGSYE